MKHASGRSNTIGGKGKSSLTIDKKKNDLINKWLDKVGKNKKGSVNDRSWEEMAAFYDNKEANPFDKEVQSLSDSYFVTSKKSYSHKGYLREETGAEDNIRLGASAVSTESLNKMRKTQQGRIAEIVNKERGENRNDRRDSYVCKNSYNSKHKIHHVHRRTGDSQASEVGSQGSGTASRAPLTERWAAKRNGTSDQLTTYRSKHDEQGEHDEQEWVTSQNASFHSGVEGQSEQSESEFNSSPKEEEKTALFTKKDLAEIETLQKSVAEKDPSVFYDMFELLLTKLSTIHDSVREIKKDQQEVSSKLFVLESSMEYMGNTIDEMDEDLGAVSDMNIKLVQATVKCEDEIIAAKEKVAKIDRALMKGCLVIKGLVIDDVRKVGKEVISEFFASKLKIEKKVEIATVSTMKNGSLWVRLTDANDIGLIFSHVSNLKGQKNAKGEHYSIDRARTEEDRETQNRHREIQVENRRMPVSHQQTITVKNGGLIINKSRYRKKVVPPTNREMLLMSAKSEEAINEAKIADGDSKSLQGSTFASYAVAVKSWSEIQKAYQKVKANNMSATHIMCGYRIFGSNSSALQDYSSDGEHFGGKQILDILKEQKVWNLAVFVVRFKNGPSLGPKRFDLIKETTRSAIANFPGPLNYGQRFSDQTLLKALTNTARKKIQDPTNEATDDQESIDQ